MVSRQPLTGNKEWGSGLFACLSDVPGCLAVYLCSCFVRGCIYYSIIKPDKKWATAACLISLAGGNLGLRYHLAEVEQIQRDPQMDCIMSCLCGQCALCQEYRYMKVKLDKPDKGPLEFYKETIGS